MILNLILCGLLLALAVLMVREEDTTTLIILFFLFSFCSACLYLLHSAPDIALAEVAVGCALVPLAFIITIMRQNTFTVAFYTGEQTQSYCDPVVLVRFMALLEEFSDLYGLKPRLITGPLAERPSPTDIFRPGSVDLLANYDEPSGILYLTGNSRNVMIPQLEKIMGSDDRIRFAAAQEGEHED